MSPSWSRGLFGLSKQGQTKKSTGNCYDKCLVKVTFSHAGDMARVMTMSVCPPPKYLNYYLMTWDKALCRLSWCPEDELFLCHHQA